MSDLQARMIRAAKLDVALYQDVKADPGAIGQATSVVALSGLAAGVGNFEATGINGIIAFTVVEVIGWYLFAHLVYFIGTKFVPEPQTDTTPKQLLQTLGFARAPGVLRVLALAPGGLNAVVLIVAGIWMLVTTVIAIRQTLGYESLWRAIGVCVLGLLLQTVILFPIMTPFLNLLQPDVPVQ